MSSANELSAGSRLVCPRCSHVLARGADNSLDTVLALSITGLIVLLISISFSFLSFEIQGQSNSISLFSLFNELYQSGFAILGFLILAFIILLPVSYLFALVVITIRVKTKKYGAVSRTLANLITKIHPWTMVDVFVFGVAIALVKIISMADIEIGISFWSYAIFTVIFIYISSVVDIYRLWSWVEGDVDVHDISRSNDSSDRIICINCHKLNAAADEHCRRCGTRLSKRVVNGLQHCIALLITSLILFIPANIYPIMTTEILGVPSNSTIVGGVLLFIEHGSYGIAIIIFVASVVVPLAKIGALFVLCHAARKQASLERKDLMRLYHTVEFIGKWSMVDVFVVAIMVGLVQLGSLTAIEPGIAAVAFCGMVILTIIAAQKFDPRLIWGSLSQMKDKS